MTTTDTPSTPGATTPAPAPAPSTPLTAFGSSFFGAGDPLPYARPDLSAPSSLESLAPEVEISSTGRRKLRVRLIGVMYTVTPPKNSWAMRLAKIAKNAEKDPESMFDALDQWIARAFGAEQARAVQARMDNDDDELDTQHLMQLMERIVEVSSGNPTM